MISDALLKLPNLAGRGTLWIVILLLAFQPLAAFASPDERGGSVSGLVQLEFELDDFQLQRGDEDGVCGFLAANLRFSSDLGLIYPEGVTLPEWRPATEKQQAFYRDALWQLLIERYGLLQGLYAHYFQQDQLYKWWRVWLESGLFLETADVPLGDQTVALVRVSDPHGWAFRFHGSHPHLIYHGASRIVHPFEPSPDAESFSTLFMDNSALVGSAPATEIIFYEDQAYAVFSGPSIGLSGQPGLSRSDYLQMTDEAYQARVLSTSMVGGKVNLAPLNQLGLSDYNDFGYCELALPASQK
ncbi:MAG: hypothetical protein KI792_02520 [Alphaproteobacteria bacterium]|nr:hypothetical protein [Alphaproteobacteria bacterium SS10]